MDTVFRNASIAIRISGIASEEHISYIKKEKGKHCVKSESNPDWSGGCYESKEKAKERLDQVEMFKHMKGKKKGKGKKRKGSAESVTLPIGGVSPAAVREGIIVNFYNPSGDLVGIQSSRQQNPTDNPKDSDVDCHMHSGGKMCTLTPLTELGEIFINTLEEYYQTKTSANKRMLQIAANVIAKISKIAVYENMIKQNLMQINQHLNSNNSKGAVVALKNMILNTKDLLEDTGDVSQVEGYIAKIENIANKIKSRPGITQIFDVAELSDLIAGIKSALKSGDTSDVVDAMSSAAVGWRDMLFRGGSAQPSDHPQTP